MGFLLAQAALSSELKLMPVKVDLGDAECLFTVAMFTSTIKIKPRYLWLMFSRCNYIWVRSTWCVIEINKMQPAILMDNALLSTQTPFMGQDLR